MGEHQTPINIKESLIMTVRSRNM